MSALAGPNDRAARVVVRAPKVALALGYDAEEALKQLDELTSSAARTGRHHPHAIVGDARRAGQPCLSGRS